MDFLFDILKDNFLMIIAVIVFSYLLGSVNFSIIITRKTMKNADIRTMGSGNAGFTNVLRSVGKTSAALTFILDFLKCVIAVMLAAFVFSTFDGLFFQSDMNQAISLGKYIAGLFVIIGHMFPLFFGFRGGKGVVTLSALVLLVDFRVFIILVIAALIAFVLTRTISVCSLAGAALYPVTTFFVTYFFDYLPNLNTTESVSFSYVIAATAATFIIGLIVIIKHKDNIKRLIKGEEKKITPKSKKQEE